MLADLLHRIRRAIWRVIAGPYSTRNVSVSRCLECGKRLTADEREHYEVNCERCEGIAWQRYAELPEPMHPDCTAPNCDCEPDIECAARGAADGVDLPVGGGDGR